MNKSTRNLLIIFAVLLIIVYFFFRKEDRESTQSVDEKIFTVDSAAIDKIEIIKTNETIVLEKQNGVWMMTSPVNYPADTTAITPILGSLQNYKIESEISSNPAKFSSYLDSANNTKVVVWQGGKAEGSFIMGKSAMGGDNSYIQTDQGKPILLASKLPQFNFVKTAKDFRNKSVISLSPLSYNSVTIRSMDSVKYEFTLTKDSLGKWFIGTDSVSEQNAMTITNLLNNVQTEDFIDSAITQFPPLTYQISVKGFQNADINFYKVNAEQPYFIVQASNNKQLFKMTTGYAGMYLKQRKDFIPEPQKKTEPQT